MKLITRALLAVLLLALALPTVASADLKQAEGNLRRLLDKMEELGFTMGNGGQGNAWWTWNVTPGHYWQIDRTFYRGNTYLLAAAGDGRVNDVDIKVFDENWNVIDTDEDESNVAVVTFVPRWTGTFHIRTINYSGQGVGSIGFVIGFHR